MSVSEYNNILGNIESLQTIAIELKGEIHELRKEIQDLRAKV